jgi:BirA family biotin operon repressor/biotin-[acetyl-CoA-carboxylase] ligase
LIVERPLPAPPRILRRNAIDSTQLEARRVLETTPSPPLPFAIVAREQTAGRGRETRAWASPAGGLWVTGAWPLTGVLDPLLGLRLGLAAIAALSEAAPPVADRLRLKWPNDVMLDRRKVAGILAETAEFAGLDRVALVGVGINANVRRRDLPPSLADSAAILAEAAGREVDMEALLQWLLDSLGEAVQARSDTAGVVSRANELLYGRDEQAALRRPDGSVVSGVLVGLDPRGEPILTGRDGARIAGPFTGYAAT